ncbi:hypothetical protein ABW19_dt0204998 [Dactylella cylindrospora]|nr:hypothetical protein ABW19_dt0204998 [Dactylella cylindrospora]
MRTSLSRSSASRDHLARSSNSKESFGLGIVLRSDGSRMSLRETNSFALSGYCSSSSKTLVRISNMRPAMTPRACSRSIRASSAPSPAIKLKAAAFEASPVYAFIPKFFVYLRCLTNEGRILKGALPFFWRPRLLPRVAQIPPDR